jgi:hypothetical protein
MLVSQLPRWPSRQGVRSGGQLRRDDVGAAAHPRQQALRKPQRMLRQSRVLGSRLVRGSVRPEWNPLRGSKEVRRGASQAGVRVQVWLRGQRERRADVRQREEGVQHGR